MQDLTSIPDTSPVHFSDPLYPEEQELQRPRSKSLTNLCFFSAPESSVCQAQRQEDLNGWGGVTHRKRNLERASNMIKPLKAEAPGIVVRLLLPDFSIACLSISFAYLVFEIN